MTLPNEDSFQMDLEEKAFPNQNPKLSGEDSAMPRTLTGGAHDTVIQCTQSYPLNHLPWYGLSDVVMQWSQMTMKSHSLVWPWAGMAITARRGEEAVY